MPLNNTAFLAENRRSEITIIFENILSDLGFCDPMEIKSIERAIISPDGEIFSESFFDVVHSELERKQGIKDSIRAVVITVNGVKILIAHEAKSMDDISHIDTKNFERVITAEDIHKTGKIEKFQGYVGEIIAVERAMRENYGIPTEIRDTSSRERVKELLHHQAAAE